MAKKRKASAAPAASESAPDTSNKRTRMRIDTYEDVAGSDDEFHMNRDKVALDDGPEAKRRRNWAEQGMALRFSCFPCIIIFNSLPDEFLQQSDEEVLGYSSPSEDDEDEEAHEEEDGSTSGKASRPSAADEEDEEGWGSTKQDYYGADTIEAEQDALDEEVEALRIQKKQLQAMSAADYGFDESDWQDGAVEDDADAEDADGAVITEILPQLEVTDRMTPVERLKILQSRYPEFEPLSQELLKLQSRYNQLTASSASLRPTALVQQQAAAAYLASLTMYFALLTSTADDKGVNGLALSASTLRDHPVMDSLIQCRTLWESVKDLPEDDESEEEPSEVYEDESVDEDAVEMPLEKARSRKTKKTKAQKAADAAREEAAARRAERMARAEADLADLDALAVPSTRLSEKSKPRAQAIAADEDSDFGEDSELTAHELAEKAKRKKSLRFYTSQIAQKANKRGAAGRNAGGDDDIPHRERLRDRQARLNAEAEARGKKDVVRDELGQDSDEEDRRQAKEIRAAADSDEEYYDMVAAKSSKKKSDKKALADAYKEAAQHGGRVVEKEEVGPDGKRAISYQIEKNKGLTPHRKKDVRNPRVKKRKKYDEKKKKLASMKPTYKGGEGRGGYGGELTGIKKGLVRSTKL